MSAAKKFASDAERILDEQIAAERESRLSGIVSELEAKARRAKAVTHLEELNAAADGLAFHAAAQPLIEALSAAVMAALPKIDAVEALVNSQHARYRDAIALAEANGIDITAVRVFDAQWPAVIGAARRNTGARLMDASRRDILEGCERWLGAEWVAK